MKESRYNIWVERPDGAYVYNGVTGTLLRVPLEQRAALGRLVAGERDHGLTAGTADKLVQGRMIVADAADELDLLRARYEASRHDRSSFALTIVTSLGCNFDCPYCFEAKHPSILSPAVEASVLQVLDDQLPHIEEFSVTWFGGEPLVGKRPLLSLSDAFIDRCDAAGVGYSASISTNGYLLTEQTCRELADRRVESAQVGLDGPPEVHDRMRPLTSGGGSFWRIVENLHHAVEHLDVAVRVNLDTTNVDAVGELLRILADEGLAGKLGVYPGHIVGVTENAVAPSATYRDGHTCFTPAEFARASLEFARLANEHGFGLTPLPTSTGTPCTAVRANELIVGSDGELYKC
ncbi:MAG: radical SAM protein [Acidimicrobiales bacterium]